MKYPGIIAEARSAIAEVRGAPAAALIAPDTIYVSRQADVALLDRFVGPKF